MPRLLPVRLVKAGTASWLERLTHELAEALVHNLGEVNGACLVACAVLTRTAADLGVSAKVVRGTFDGHAHWWLEWDGVRFDPTRGQFDAGPLVSPIRNNGDLEFYGPERSFPAERTHEQVLQEAERAFEVPSAGSAVARKLMDHLAATCSGLA